MVRTSVTNGGGVSIINYDEARSGGSDGADGSSNDGAGPGRNRGTTNSTRDAPRRGAQDDAGDADVSMVACRRRGTSSRSNTNAGLPTSLFITFRRSTSNKKRGFPWRFFLPSVGETVREYGGMEPEELREEALADQELEILQPPTRTWREEKIRAAQLEALPEECAPSTFGKGTLMKTARSMLPIGTKVAAEMAP